MNNVELLIIDPQIDFCSPNGSLYINGAHEDMIRLGNMIETRGSKINNINISLESNNLINISHPLFWKNEKRKHPIPFTIISLKDIKEKKWQTTYSNAMPLVEKYIYLLNKNNKNELCILPPHCLIGNQGQNICPHLYDILLQWQTNYNKNINYIIKKDNIYTEYYGIFEEEINEPCCENNNLSKNKNLIKFENIEMLLIAGEAGSHCVKATIEQLINFFGNDYAKKIVLIRDAISPIEGYENYQNTFISEMMKIGMQLTTTIDF